MRKGIVINNPNLTEKYFAATKSDAEEIKNLSKQIDSIIEKMRSIETRSCTDLLLNKYKKSIGKIIFITDYNCCNLITFGKLKSVDVSEGNELIFQFEEAITVDGIKSDDDGIVHKALYSDGSKTLYISCTSQLNPENKRYELSQQLQKNIKKYFKKIVKYIDSLHSITESAIYIDNPEEEKRDEVKFIYL